MKGLASAANGAAASAGGALVAAGVAVAGAVVAVGLAVGTSRVTCGLKASWVDEAEVEFVVGLASGVASLHAVTNMNATIVQPDKPARRRFDLATRAVVQSAKGFANGILARIIEADHPCRLVLKSRPARMMYALIV